MKDIFIDVVKFSGCLFISCLVYGFLMGLAVKFHDWFGPKDDPDGDLMSIIIMLVIVGVTLLTGMFMEVIK